MEEAEIARDQSLCVRRTVGYDKRAMGAVIVRTTSIKTSKNHPAPCQIHHPPRARQTRKVRTNAHAPPTNRTTAGPTASVLRCNAVQLSSAPWPVPVLQPLIQPIAPNRITSATATKTATNFTAAAVVARSRCGLEVSGDIFMALTSTLLAAVVPVSATDCADSALTAQTQNPEGGRRRRAPGHTSSTRLQPNRTVSVSRSRHRRHRQPLIA